MMNTMIDVKKSREVINKSWHWLKDIEEDLNGLISVKRDKDYGNSPALSHHKDYFTESLAKHIQLYNNLNPHSIITLPGNMDIVNLIVFRNNIIRLKEYTENSFNNLSKISKN